MKATKLGPLDVRIVGGSDGLGGGDGPVVVLMHGFGAGGDDLVPLAQYLRVSPGIRFVFPEAPLRLPPEMGGYGRMWWPIDTEALARSMHEGRPRDLRGDDPEGLAPARTKLIEMLHALRDGIARDASALVLGGFSQGSMLACDVAFRTDEPLDGLVVLSGTHVAANAWGAGMPARASLPVFQSHGTHDTLLAFPMAESLRDAMTDAGIRVGFHPFRGGHEIPMPVLRELGGFLAAVGR